jgi:4-hydroxy-4-methyl-2-oxoglutarate aldolase
MKTSNLFSLLKGLMCADIVDAMNKTYSHKTNILDMVSPDPRKVLFGPAVTIGFLPVRKDFMDPQRHSLGPLFYRAISGEDPTGKVLVMASNGHQDISLGGGTKLSRLQNHKMAGVLCDGRLRDFDELLSYNFASYCKGETTRAGGNFIQPYTANTPVVVDGVTVIPGDYVYADQSGAAIIPEKDVEQILNLAHKILDMTSKAAMMMKTEDPNEILNKGSNEL